MSLDEKVAHRLTSGKRISYVTAGDGRVVVAAADQNVDRLALVKAGGALGPIPGLGRPDAFSPVLDGDSLLYQTFRHGQDGGVARFHVWNSAQGEGRIFFRSRERWEGPVVGPGGRTAFLDRAKGDDRIVVRTRRGELRRFAVAPEIADYVWGRRLIAATEVEPGSQFGQEVLGTVLLNPRTSRTTRVPGWAPIAFSPYGDDALLVRKVGTGPDTVLGLLYPDELDRPPLEIMTLPSLTVFQGAWAERKPPLQALIIPEGEGGEVASRIVIGVTPGEEEIVRREP